MSQGRQGALHNPRKTQGVSVFRAVATLVGFVLGVTAGGVTLSGGLITILIVQSAPSGVDARILGVAFTLSAITLVFGFLLVRGAVSIWKLSVYGGALNLALGALVIVVTLVMMTLLFDFFAPPASLALFWSIYPFTGFTAIASGLFGTIAHGEQIRARFTAQQSSLPTFRVEVASPRDGPVEVEVDEAVQVGSLKKRVCEAVGIPEDRANLLYRGVMLRNEQRLGDVGISQRERIFLITSEPVSK